MNKKIKGFIESNLTSLQRKKQLLELVPVDRLGFYYGGQGDLEYYVALFYLADNNLAAAKSYLEQAVASFLKAIKLTRPNTPLGNNPVYVRKVLEIGILLDNKKIMDHGIQEFEYIKPKDKNELCTVCGVLAGLIKADNEMVRKFAGKNKFFPHFGEAALALINNDKFQEAIQAVLQTHHKKVIQTKGQVGDDFVCVPATILLILAKKKGISLGQLPDNLREYIPEVLTGD